MQTLDLPCNPAAEPHSPDPSAMSDNSSPIHSQNDNSSKDDIASVQNNSSSAGKNNDSSNSVVVRRERPSRACTQRAAARLQAAAEAEAAMAEVERKRKRAKREKIRVVKEESEEDEGSFGVEDDVDDDEGEENGEEGGGSPSSSSRPQCSKIVTPLVGELEPAQLPRWNIRSMWQLASILNFLNVFRHLLNIKVEFSAEEFETALINPNNTLGDVHIPLLKAIPPVTRMALGHNTWVTVLCRKLRDWWHWVAEGDLPIVASHGAEIEAYNTLEPEVRVVILKALCDIRVEQEDIRSYIDDSIKRGIHLSVFRKERIGGDSTGISYWYEDDPVIGYRLYREIRKVEVKKGKGKTVAPIPHSSYEWEAVATNFDEFVNVSEKLFSSKNRTEVAVGKKLKNDMLPEIEKEHKRREKLLKKQHRQALMLDNMINMDSLVGGRSLRDRKPVTYTFDDYDRSINEAIKVTKKKQLSPEPYEKREHLVKIEGSSNGGSSSTWGGDDGPAQYPRHDSFTAVSANSLDEDDDYDDNNDDNNDDEDDGYYDDQTTETLDRSNRRRQKPQRYSVNDFVEPHSDNDPDFESDDEIVGEVVYDDEYLKKRNNKKRKTSSSSESEEEYRWNDENPEEEEDEEEEEEDDDNDSSNSDDDDSDNPKPRKFKSMPRRTLRGTKSRSVDELQAGLRRSKRATRNQINYSQYEMSESENELTKHEKPDALDEQHFDESDNELSMGSRDFEENNIDEDKMMMMPENENNEVPEEKTENFDEEKQMDPPQEEEPNGRDQEEGGDGGGVGKRRFLDLNELAPGSGFDDGPASTRDEDEF